MFTTKWFRHLGAARRGRRGASSRGRRAYARKLRLETLEDRRLLAWLEVLEVPEPSFSGDGKVLSQAQNLGPAGDDKTQARFAINLSAGQGPSSGIWSVSERKFALAGAYTLAVRPDTGEHVGDPVQIDLITDYRVSGGLPHPNSKPAVGRCTPRMAGQTRTAFSKRILSLRYRRRDGTCW